MAEGQEAVDCCKKTKNLASRTLHARGQSPKVVFALHNVYVSVDWFYEEGNF